MIEFDNGGRLITDVSELPQVPKGGIKRLYSDVETTSHDDRLDALSPWQHCWVAGIAATWDDMPGAVYVPVDHRDRRWNLPREAVINWYRDVMRASTTWVNHNVKYDAHAVYNDLGINHEGEKVCTVVRAKIIDSDRQFRGGYGLDALSIGWLKEDISGVEDDIKLMIGKSKDYGICPADKMGKYACQDVITNRRLDKYQLAVMPEESARVVRNETRLTSILIEMERKGLLVKPAELLIEKLFVLQRMAELEQKMHEYVGWPFLPTSNPDCFEVLCNRYSLPVLTWTVPTTEGGKSNPSFDADTLELYSNRIDAPRDLVAMMIEYRKLSTFKGLFLETYQRLAAPTAGGYATLHPDHNQCVRTGRMSVKQPNSQQLNKRAKKLIHPGDGMSFLSCDASQIEFRTIAHYTNDQDVIAAYVADPDVDYHQRVADMVGTQRRPAKTINFSVAFGQGKKATVALLETDKDVVAAIADAVDKLVERGALTREGRDAAFKSLARQKGEATYDRYHETFPGIRRTSREACEIAKIRGYVRNIMGRRRYLPAEHAHKAFNTLNQSSAADIVKERMVALYDATRGTGIELLTQVHDEIVSVGPTEVIEDPRTTRDILAVLEDVDVLKVPVRFKFGVSSKDWADAGSQERSIPLDEIKLATQLKHLKS